MFDQADVMAFVGELIDAKNYTTLDEQDRNLIKGDLAERFIAQLELSLAKALPEDKANELADRLDNGDLSDEEIANFMRENGVNIEEITSKTKNDFKKFFLSEETVNTGEEN